jgi:hypothetical protein
MNNNFDPENEEEILEEDYTKVYEPEFGGEV